MPVGRWGWEWVRTRYAAGNGAAKAVIVALGVCAALVYLASALWFDVAYWVLGRFATDRVGRRARVGFSIAIAVLVVLSISASGASTAPKQTPLPGGIAAAAASPVPETPAVASSFAPTGAQTQGVIALSPTPSPTLASFIPAATGQPFVGSAGSPSDRLPGEPDASLTPGALNPDVTQANIGSTICVSGWTATVRPSSDYTSALKIQQMTEYGYSDTSTSAYEEDHLISLELGGAPTDPRNLWPQPYVATLSDGRPTGAQTKDGFETKLKDEVCNGTVTLARAQSEIGDAWVHAFYGIPFASATPTAGPSATPAATTAPSASSGPTLSVRITSLPAKVRHGSNATVAAVTAPGARCSARVTYASGTVSTAKGLAAEKTASSAGKVSWTWTIGGSTGPGVATAEVECSMADDSASDSRDFQVIT